MWSAFTSRLRLVRSLTAFYIFRNFHSGYHVRNMARVEFRRVAFDATRRPPFVCRTVYSEIFIGICGPRISGELGSDGLLLTPPAVHPPFAWRSSAVRLAFAWRSPGVRPPFAWRSPGVRLAFVRRILYIPKFSSDFACA